MEKVRRQNKKLYQEKWLQVLGSEAVTGEINQIKLYKAGADVRTSLAQTDVWPEGKMLSSVFSYVPFEFQIQFYFSHAELNPCILLLQPKKHPAVFT